MFRSPLLAAVGALVLAAPFDTAQGTVIEYEVTNRSGNLWQYDYTVTNDTLGASLDEFTIFFQLDLYDNIAFGAAPGGWDPLAIQPDPGLPADGFYDALALVSGIAPGETLGQFAVTFNWLGVGTPGSQLFNVVDPITIDTLDSGFTRLRATTPSPTPVDEPGVLQLLAAAIVVLAFGAFRSRRNKNDPGATMRQGA